MKGMVDKNGRGVRNGSSNRLQTSLEIIELFSLVIQIKLKTRAEY